jgi:hypothetical protein
MARAPQQDGGEHPGRPISGDYHGIHRLPAFYDL